MPTNNDLRLTQTVQKGGCAAKVPAVELRAILKSVRFPPASPNLLVDGAHFDDAAIYQINESMALVQTLDFFTPIVDDPYSFGQVATANALSDVYAMGGRPVTAMAILAVPLATFTNEVTARILQGASDLLREARTDFVGGHSIDDDTLKFGMSVTGMVHPARVWSNQGAKAGDALILTKPLGTGAATAALKRSAVTESDIEDVITSMRTLNNVVDCVEPRLLGAVHAATDITGFGLSGHGMQMAKASQKSLIIELPRVPVFERAPALLQEGFLTKAHRTNKSYTESALRLTGLQPWQELVIHDPQTSGGLLLSVASESAAELLNAIRARFHRAEIIGRVEEAGGESTLTIRA
ncbi:MAG TPA: selenide, water dikinase SelD [Bdellovibrionales bacterium]|nr:selenide, water dikinase SelD [Bdellovibrionales bacterium]